MGAFTMPSLGSDMEDGTLLDWLVKPGDVVERGQIIAVVETQKGAIEIETFEAGVVRSLQVEEGAKVPVGTVLAVIGEASPEQPPPVKTAEPSLPPPAPAAEPSLPPPAPAAEPSLPPPAPAAELSRPSPAPAAYHPSILPPASPGDRVRASPAARVAARELGVDLHDVHGTGPHGAVRRPDVVAFADQGAASPTPPATAPVAPPVADPSPAMRRAIAAAMSRANRDIPHYHLAEEIDLAAALAWLSAQNAGRPLAERILPAALLVRATALALQKHPELNGTWVTTDDDRVGSFVPADGIHPGIAVSLRGGGLVIPALLDADQRSLAETMAGLSDLVERARAGRLRASELSRSTLTITNLGDTGTDLVHGIVYPPQVALVGFGRIAPRPVAIDGMLGVRPTVVATLAADHRASDGHAGARFLTRMSRLLQKPEKLT